MKIKFYRCAHCGNIAIKVVDSNVPLICCGEPMEELVPDTVDAAIEKHVPVVHIEGRHVHVNVGSIEHPMTPEHHIQFICLVTDKGYSIAPLSCDDAPAADFAILPDEKPLAVYEYCNLHGLWITEL